MKQLKEFQKKGVEFLINRKTALLADDMGLGKTVQAAAAIDRLKPKRTLVLTLASLKINWARELKNWINQEINIQILFKTSDKVNANADIIVCNYDLIIRKELRSQLTKLDYDIVILDEAHCLANREAQRTKAVYGQYGLIRTANRVYALTGTPIKNRPREFYIMLKVLAPGCIEPYLDYEGFVVKYCGGYRDSYGALNDKGASNVEELANNIKFFMLRRTKEEVLPELPPLIEKHIDLELTSEIQSVLDEENNLYENANEYNPDSELGIQAKTRRLLGLAKLPQVIDYIKGVLSTEQKVVVFAFHRDVIDSIRITLKGYGVRVVAGGLNAKLRQMEIDLFINDPNSRIFVGQFTAAGFGIDGLQKVASNIIYAEIDWVPGNMDQAKDRLRRIGQVNPVIAHYLIVPNTLEDNMYRAVLNKKKVINKLVSSNEEVSNIKQEKEKKDMTIEENLERIANSLEKLVGVQEAMVQSTALASVPVGEPKKKSTKKAVKKEPVAEETTPSEPVEEPVEEPVANPITDVDDFMAEVTAAGEAAPVYTLDDVRTAFSQFITRYSKDRNTSVLKAKEILTKYKCSKVTDLTEEHFAAVINDLNNCERVD